MSDYLGNAGQRGPTRSLNKENITWWATVTFGATSSVASQDAPDPGIVATASTTGTFTLTFPKCTKGVLRGNLYSPSLTVVSVIVTAVDYTAGTATIKTVAYGGAAADPGTGDVLYLSFEGQGRE
jgi:hypothetical protein